MTVDTLGRAIRLYRRTAASRSAVLLVVANLIPLVGVLFFGWSLWTILVLYWVENGIVGFWNAPRILLAQGATIPKVMPPMPEDAAWAASGGDPVKAAGLRAAWEEARQAQQRAIDAANAGSPAGVTPASGPGSGAFRGVRVFGRPVDGNAGRAGLAIFFLMHYGIFWFVHGMFIFLLPTFFGGQLASPSCDGFPQLLPGDVLPPGFSDACTSPFGDIVWPNVVLGAALLFLSHGASFLFNYIGRGEYLTTTPMRQMGAPYGRLVVLHVTILLGAFAIVFFGSPIGALLLLIALKTALDLGLHLRERRNADAHIPADTTYGQVIREA